MMVKVVVVIKDIGNSGGANLDVTFSMSSLAGNLVPNAQTTIDGSVAGNLEPGLINQAVAKKAREIAEDTMTGWSMTFAVDETIKIVNPLGASAEY